MANIQALFEAVLDTAAEGNGKKIRIPVINRSEHETIRTRLVTLWTQHKEAILAIGGEDSDPLYPLSLCATFYKERSDKDDDTGNGGSRSEFWLGKPRRKAAKDYSFTIVSEEDTSSAMLGEAANEPTPNAIKLPAS